MVISFYDCDLKNHYKHFFSKQHVARHFKSVFFFCNYTWFLLQELQYHVIALLSSQCFEYIEAVLQFYLPAICNSVFIETRASFQNVPLPNVSIIS